MKKLLLLFLKLTISVGIIAFLVYQALQQKDVETGRPVLILLLEGSKHWEDLTLGLMLCAAAVSGTILRWRGLLHVLDVEAPFFKTLRIGYVGYLFNLAPMGVAGGDLLKAWMLTRINPGKGTKILAAVFVDRMIGLFALFLLASCSILIFGTLQSDSGLLRTISAVVLFITVLGTICMLFILGPDFSGGKVLEMIGRTPKIGDPLKKIITYIRFYNQHLGAFTWAVIQTLFIHILFSGCIFCIACGLFENHPSMFAHLILSPVSLSTTAIPLPFGPLELVLDMLYPLFTQSGNPVIAGGVGLAVGLAYRVICILVAALGYVFYLTDRQDIKAVMKQSEEEKLPEVVERPGKVTQLER